MSRNAIRLCIDNTRAGTRAGVPALFFAARISACGLVRQPASDCRLRRSYLTNKRIV